MSQTLSALGDHSEDIFGTFKNLSTLVSALHDSTGLLEQLNRNLAAVTSLLADDPNKVGQTVGDLNAVVGDLQSFAADNREALGTASDKLASITTTLVESLDDIKQALHVAPGAFQNFSNIFEPANGSFTGALAVNNFANPIAFICGAIQAASRLGAEQASKLCVQYLAPIVKNRQYNWPPLGLNPFVGAQGPTQRGHLQRGVDAAGLCSSRRPTRRPAAKASRLRPSKARPWRQKRRPPPLAAEAPPPNEPPATVSTDPAAGLPGMMVPPGGG